VLFTAWSIWDSSGAESGWSLVWDAGSAEGEEPSTIDRIRTTVIGTTQHFSVWYLVAFVLSYSALVHYTLVLDEQDDEDGA
jgi:hypothetical protein